jgi:hypothetical protein
MDDLKFTTAGEYMKDRCETCGEYYSSNCDYKQGRCPHHPPLIDTEKLKFYNVLKTIKDWFKK